MLGLTVRYLTILVIVALASEVFAQADHDLKLADAMPDLTLGGWQLSAEWTGYMGVSLQFKADNTFKYWFFSDVVTGDEPQYPISGTWKADGMVISLDANGAFLYSEKYYIMMYKGSLCLFPESNYQAFVNGGKVDLSRLHFRNASFATSEPYSGRVSYKSLK